MLSRRRIGSSGTQTVLVAALAVTLLGLAACGGGGGGAVDSGNRSQPPKTSVPAGQAEDFVGLTKQRAIAKAEAEGRPWRIGREDGESFPLTQDYVENRVTFEIDDGTVTAATFG